MPYNCERKTLAEFLTVLHTNCNFISLVILSNYLIEEKEKIKIS